jgi:hypothetical protein
MTTVGHILVPVLAIAGLITALIGWIWFLVAAFRESILWGLACLFLPIVSLIFLILHWNEAKRPFFVQLLAMALLIAAAVLGGGLAAIHSAIGR